MLLRGSAIFNFKKLHSSVQQKLYAASLLFIAAKSPHFDVNMVVLGFVGKKCDLSTCGVFRQSSDAKSVMNNPVYADDGSGLLRTVRSEEEICPATQRGSNNTQPQYEGVPKVSLYHIFEFDSFHLIGEVYKLFIRNVSLCVLVTDSSEGACQEELDLLQNSISYASKGLVVELSTSQQCAKNISLHQFSQFLVKNTDDPLSYVFFLDPSASNNAIGASIVNHALSSSLSTRFPQSWYLFGYRLKQCMVEHGTNSLSLSNEGMEIAEELGMDRPNAVAALDHLMEHSMLLFFNGILSDTVFLGVEMFSRLFSILYKVSDKCCGTFDDNDFQRVVNSCIKKDDFVSCENLLTLLMKLLVMAHNDYSNTKAYLMPCFLPILDEVKRKMECNRASSAEYDPVYFKCPSSGFEFISMLTVFLLGNKEWRIFLDETGHPVCLYKNCIKFQIPRKKCVVTISYSRSENFIEVYIQADSKSDYSLNQISTLILQGLERSKILLNSYHSFNFAMSFPCHCGKIDQVHRATYCSETGLLRCENDGGVTGKFEILRSACVIKVKSLYIHCKLHMCNGWLYH